MTAADYINEYIARRAPYDMVAPWRNRNRLIQALWHKQDRWDQSKTLEGCAKPSAEWDTAFDAYVKAGTKYQTAIIEAWTLRALERGYTQSQRAA